MSSLNQLESPKIPHFNLCIGATFRVKGKTYIVTGLSWKAKSDKVDVIYFCSCEITYKSAILGDKVFKKPAQELYGLLNTGELEGLGWRELPANFVGSV